MKIADIRRAIQTYKVRITDHADEEAESDEFTFDEIYLSVLNGEIIEDYPDDRPYPSCLVYGNTFGGIYIDRTQVDGSISEKEGRKNECGGELQCKEVEKLLRGGKNTAVLRVNAEVCLHCGERLYTEDTIRYFESLRNKLKRQETAEFQTLGQSFKVKGIWQDKTLEADV